MGLLYKLTSPSGKSYIGMTLRTMEHRMKEHRRTQFSGCRYLVNAINKHGFGNFTQEVLWEGEDTQTPEMERIMILEHNTLAPNGYNLKTGGGRGERYSKDQSDYMSYRLRESYKLKNGGLLGCILTTTSNGKKDGPTRYRLRFAGKNFGTFKTLEECIKVQTDLTNNPDVYLEKYTSTLSPPVSVFEVTQRLGRTVWIISYKGIYLGTWTNREIVDKVRHYILEHDKKWEREELINTLKVDGLTEYLPEIPNYKYVKFRKSTGNWVIQISRGSSRKKREYTVFGEWISETHAYIARDYILEYKLKNKDELIHFLKSKNLHKYLPNPGRGRSSKPPSDSWSSEIHNSIQHVRDIVSQEPKPRRLNSGRFPPLSKKIISTLENFLQIVKKNNKFKILQRGIIPELAHILDSHTSHATLTTRVQRIYKNISSP